MQAAAVCAVLALSGAGAAMAAPGMAADAPGGAPVALTAPDPLAAPIVGSAGNSGNDGGRGADAPSGRGGSGGNGTVGEEGGSAFQGGNQDVTNPGAMQGGAGGRGGNGGQGGHGLSSNGFGGYGGNGNSGGSGGSAIRGDMLDVTNPGSLLGGTGGTGGTGGRGGNSDRGDAGRGGTGGGGGHAVQGSGLRIVNQGEIQGGKGGAGGNGGIGGDCTNCSFFSGRGGAGGNGGVGGDAIQGGDLTIENTGRITHGAPGAGAPAGRGGKFDEGIHGPNGTAGANGAAIRLTGGANRLILDTGSNIDGDIVVARQAAGPGATRLSVVSKAATAITGSLVAQQGTHVALSGAPLTLDGTLDLRNNATLSIMDAGVGDPVAERLLANTAQLGAGSVFNLSGVTDASATDKALFGTTTGAIASNFANVVIGGIAAESDPGDPARRTTDYLTLSTQKAADQKSFRATYQLTWFDAGANAHGDFTIGEGGEFTVGKMLDDQPENAVWNGASLTKKGAGTLILTADNTYSGGTAIEGGALVLGDGGTKGAVRGNIANHGALVFNRGDDVVYGDVVSGAGDLVQAGTGALILDNRNTYSGGTTLRAGTIKTGVADAFANTSRVTLARGATLDLDGKPQMVGAGAALDNAGSILTGGAAIRGSALAITNGGSIIGGAGDVLRMTGGANTLRLDPGSVITGDVALSDAGESVENLLAIINTIHDGVATLTGNLLAGAGTGVTLSGDPLTVTGRADFDRLAALTLKAGSGLSAAALRFAPGARLSMEGVAADGAVNLTADTVSIGQDASFELSGLADKAQIAGAEGRVLFSAAHAIEGDFTHVTVHGFVGDVDYLTLQTRKSEDGKRYLARYGLSWLAHNNLANGTFTLDAGARETLDAALADVGANPDLAWDGKRLTKNGDGALILTGDATYSGGTLIAGGTLALGDGGTTGSLTGNIVNNAALVFDRGDDVAFGGDISGTGTLTKQGAGALTLAGGHAYGGDTIVRAGTLRFGDGATTAVNTLGGNIQVANAATLSVQTPAVVHVAGRLALEDGASLSLRETRESGPQAESLTADTVTIGNDVAFNLSGVRQQSVQERVLFSAANGIVGDFARVTVGGFSTTVDYLTLRTRKSADAKRYLAEYGLNWFDANGQAHGAFTLDDGASFTVDTALGDMTANPANGWDGERLTKKGDGVLILGADNTYSGGTVIEGGTLQVGAGGAAGAVQGDIANGGALIFDRGDAVAYGGVISGPGSVAKQGGGTLTLTGDNTYLGGTTITGGTLAVGDGGASGSLTGDIANAGTLVFHRSDAVAYGGAVSGTGALVQRGTGTLVLTGDHTYTGGTVIESGALNLGNGGGAGLVRGDIVNNGTLAFDRGDDVQFGGVISGAGGVDKYGENTLTLTGDSTYTGATVIRGEFRLGNGGVSGSVQSDIVNGGSVTFDRGDDVEYRGVISGDGDVRQQGAGTLILAGANTYRGNTLIAAGTLKTGVAHAIAATSGVQVKEGATLNLNGRDQTFAMLRNSGVLLINDLGAPALAGSVTVTGNIENRGRLVLDNCAGCAGQTYVQQGDWVGDNGTVSFGTVLGGDGSATDRLRITGAATGTTYVEVRNEGGAGAQTLEGIELIQTASSTDDAFVQKGRITVGAYDYHLQKGSASGNNQSSWYLTSEGRQRPELGSYASNQAATTLFNTRLSERQRGDFLNPITGQPYRHSLWVRAAGGRGQARLSGGQSRFTADRTVFQIGAEIRAGSFGAQDAWHLGVMAGNGRQRSTTRSSQTGYQSRGSVDGYGAGLYGTWYRNAQTHAGLYVDGWALYNQFDNTVQGDGRPRETYRSRGISASVESGFVFAAGTYATGRGSERRFFIRPQAQLIWSGVTASAHTDHAGTRVTGEGGGNLQTRLGTRLWMTSNGACVEACPGQPSGVEPFVEVNWLHLSKSYGARMGETRALLQGTRDSVEWSVGLEGGLGKGLRVAANVARQQGGYGYRDTRGALSVSYRF
ncbi:MAG: autotransporter outer membrane beta-barrel domain-containing protein [Achromobacter sp.]|uniref:autotransporter outer membrane beta-barrel domain-containing protein n=1 Tax=Achromobacter sp. TaxID=134375 RepID=UPI003D089047